MGEGVRVAIDSQQNLDARVRGGSKALGGASQLALMALAPLKAAGVEGPAVSLGRVAPAPAVARVGNQEWWGGEFLNDADLESTPYLKGSGPAPGVLEISSASKSTASFQNYHPRGGAIEYVFDPATRTFLVGDAPVAGSPHESLVKLIPDVGEKPVGGMFGRGPNGEFETNEFSGHYWKNWTPDVRRDFVSFMMKHGIEIKHTDGM